jgi:hypothetical protein
LDISEVFIIFYLIIYIILKLLIKLFITLSIRPPSPTPIRLVIRKLLFFSVFSPIQFLKPLLISYIDALCWIQINRVEISIDVFSLIAVVYMHKNCQKENEINQEFKIVSKIIIIF